MGQPQKVDRLTVLPNENDALGIPLETPDGSNGPVEIVFGDEDFQSPSSRFRISPSKCAERNSVPCEWTMAWRTCSVRRGSETGKEAT